MDFRSACVYGFRRRDSLRQRYVRDERRVSGIYRVEVYGYRVVPCDLAIDTGGSGTAFGESDLKISTSTVYAAIGYSF